MERLGRHRPVALGHKDVRGQPLFALQTPQRAYLVTLHRVDTRRAVLSDGVDGPLAASTCQTGVLKNHQEWEPSMSEITTIGLDLAKHVFQVHGIDAQGTTVLRKRLRRGQVLAFFSRIPRCVVGLEACATAHYWARELGALGHEVRLMPAQYVKAYIKRNKHDAADAEAICEAVGRSTMRFVPVKRQSNRRRHCCIVAASNWCVSDD